MLSSSRMSWESASEHCRAMRTAICPIVLRARPKTPPSVWEPEHHVDAERTALANELFQQHRGVLGELVVLGEEDLELVDDQHGARHGLARRFAIGGEVLHAGLAEQVAPAGHFGVQRCRMLRPNSRSLSMAIARACGRWCVA